MNGFSSYEWLCVESNVIFQRIFSQSLTSHSNFLSFKWTIRLCLFRFVFVLNFFTHSLELQTNCLSFEWINWWTFKSLKDRNSFWHSLHLNRLSYLWLNRCFFSWILSRHLNPQLFWKHLNFIDFLFDLIKETSLLILMSSTTESLLKSKSNRLLVNSSNEYCLIFSL